VSYGYCFAAIAANEQLDVSGAEAHLRHAIRIALLPTGRPTYVAKLAGALLGELLYEGGHIEEAEVLLDDACELGAEGGIVDFLLAAFGTGARLKVGRGDTAAARSRIAEGLQIARTFELPRLEARLLYEHVRLAAISGEPIDESTAGRIKIAAGEPPGGIGDVAAELMEDAQIRLLLLDGTSSGVDAACCRARDHLERIAPSQRPRAHLQATLQYALCLGVAGRLDEAHRVLSPALRTCAALGLRRLLIDEGPQMIRLAEDAVAADQFGSADPTILANVRDFVTGLSETSSV
jgi:serine/threonine-protein kinase/serine/threonine-protein kinase PknK